MSLDAEHEIALLKSRVKELRRGRVSYGSGTIVGADPINQKVDIQLPGGTILKGVPAPGNYIPEIGHQVPFVNNGDAPTVLPPDQPLTSAAPAQVTGVFASPGIGSLVVRWAAIMEADVKWNRGYYQVQTDTANTFATTNLKSVDAPGTSCTVPDLIPGTTYYVRVRALDYIGTFGAWSTPITAVPSSVSEDDLDFVIPPGVESVDVLPPFTPGGPLPLPITTALRLNYDFSDTSRITAAAGAVSAYDDLGTNNLDPVQATAGRKPTTGTRTQSGLNTLDFDSTTNPGQWLGAPAFTRAQPITIYVVAKLDTTALGVYPNRQMVGSGNAAGPTVYMHATGKWAMYAGTEIPSATNADTNPHVFSTIFNGASSQMWLDGTSILTGNPGAAGWTASNNVNIGGNGIAATPGSWDGQIDHVLMYDGAHTTTDRQTMENHLRDRWINGIVLPVTGSPAGTVVYLTTDKKLYISDGTQWLPQLSGLIGGGNVLKNSSFEDTTGFGNNWSMDATYETWSSDTSDFRYGSRSAKFVVNTGGGAFGGNPDHYGKAQALSIPSKNYEGPWVASAWIKGPAGKQIGVSVWRAYDVGGVPTYTWVSGFPADGNIGASIDVIATGAWQRIILPLPADTSTTPVYEYNVRAGVGTAASYANGDTVRIDGVQFEVGDVATAYAPKPDEVLPLTITNSQISDLNGAKILTDTITGLQIAPVTITDAEIFGVDGSKIATDTIGALQIAPLAVTQAEIANATITSGKIGAGEIKAGNIGANEITSGKIAAGEIKAVNIGANEITSGKIAAGEIKAINIGASEITSGKIAAGEIKAINIGANEITSGKIAAGEIKAVNIGANEVTAGKIAAGAVTAGTIAAGAVTTEKLTVAGISDSVLLNSGFEELQTAPGEVTMAAHWRRASGTTTQVFVDTAPPGGAQSGKNVLRLNGGSSVSAVSDTTPVAVGDVWYVSAMVRSLTGTSPQFYMRATGGALQTDLTDISSSVVENVTPPATFFKYEAQVTVPAGYKWLGISFYNWAGSTSDILIDSVEMRKVVVGTTILPNAITTNHIQADSINLGHMKVDSVDSNQIKANAVNTAELHSDAVDAGKLAAVTMEAGKYIRSTTYVAGSAGWNIAADGSAEFGNVIVRGTVDSSYVKASTFSGAVGANAILNPGAEVDVSSWSIDAGLGTVVRDTAIKRSGSGSFKLTAVSAASYVRMWTTASMDVKPGVAYSATVFYRPVSGAAAQRVTRIQMLVYDAAFSPVTSMQADQAGRGSLNWGGITVTTYGPLPSNARYIQLVLYLLNPSAGEAVNFDDISLQPLSTMYGDLYTTPPGSPAVNVYADSYPHVILNTGVDGESGGHLYRYVNDAGGATSNCLTVLTSGYFAGQVAGTDDSSISLQNKGNAGNPRSIYLQTDNVFAWPGGAGGIVPIISHMVCRNTGFGGTVTTSSTGFVEITTGVRVTIRKASAGTRLVCRLNITNVALSSGFGPVEFAVWDGATNQIISRGYLWQGAVNVPSTTIVGELLHPTAVNPGLYNFQVMWRVTGSQTLQVSADSYISFSVTEAGE